MVQNYISVNFFTGKKCTMLCLKHVSFFTCNTHEHMRFTPVFNTHGNHMSKYMRIPHHELNPYIKQYTCKTHQDTSHLYMIEKIVNEVGMTFTLP